MQRRAFLSVVIDVGSKQMMAWGTITLSWPPSHDEISEAADRLANAKAENWIGVVITALTWIGPVVDE